MNIFQPKLRREKFDDDDDDDDDNNNNNNNNNRTVLHTSKVEKYWDPDVMCDNTTSKNVQTL